MWLTPKPLILRALPRHIKLTPLQVFEPQVKKASKFARMLFNYSADPCLSSRQFESITKAEPSTTLLIIVCQAANMKAEREQHHQLLC
jgi:hypothetical protein